MILAFGTYDAARHPRVGIIVDGLRAHGLDVEEINRPLGFSTAERVRMLKQPWRLPLLLVRLVSCWWRLSGDARSFRRSSGRPDAVVVGYLGHFDVFLARWLFRTSPIVLDHLIFAGDTAADRGAAGVKVRLLNALDKAALKRADIAVVDTPEHRQLLPEPAKGVVVPVGATRAWFDAGDARAPAADADGPAAASIIFFGLYTPLQGTVTIAQALAALLSSEPEVRVTMVGTGQDRQAAQQHLTDAERVTWIDWIEPSQLPALVAAHDICLGIFGDGPKALRVVPNKVYEGLAAGCAVVTSDTPPQRSLVGDAALLTPPADPAALAQTLRALVTSAAELRSAQAAARELAQSFTPAAVVVALMDALAADGRTPAGGDAR